MAGNKSIEVGKCAPVTNDGGMSRREFLKGSGQAIKIGFLYWILTGCGVRLETPSDVPQIEDGTDQLLVILQEQFKDQLKGAESLAFGIQVKPELSCDRTSDTGSLAVLVDSNNAIWATCSAPLETNNDSAWEIPEGSRVLALAKIEPQNPKNSSIQLLVPNPTASTDNSSRYFRIDPKNKEVKGWFAIDTSNPVYQYQIGDVGNDSGLEMNRWELKVETMQDRKQITPVPTETNTVEPELTYFVASKQTNADELNILSTTEYNFFSSYDWHKISSVSKDGTNGEIFRTVFDSEGEPLAVATPGSDQAYTVTGGFVFTETQSWKWLADQNKFIGVEVADEIKQMLESGGQLVTSKEGWPTIVNSDGYARAVLPAGRESDGKWIMDTKLGLLFDESGNYQWIPETKEWKPIPKGSIVMDQEHDLENLVELIPENLNDYRDKFFEYLVLLNPKFFSELNIADGESLKTYLQENDWTLLPIAGNSFLRLPRTWIGISITELSKAPLDKPIRFDVLPILLAEAEEYDQGLLNYKETPLFNPNYLVSPYSNNKPTDKDAYSVRLGVCPIDTGSEYVFGFELATTSKGGDNFGFPKRIGSEVLFTQGDVDKLNTYLKYILLSLRAQRVVEGQDNLVVPGPKGNGGEQIYMGTGTADDWGVIKLFAITYVVEDWAKKGGLENTPFAPKDILRIR